MGAGFVVYIINTMKWRLNTGKVQTIVLVSYKPAAFISLPHNFIFTAWLANKPFS